MAKDNVWRPSTGGSGKSAGIKSARDYKKAKAEQEQLKSAGAMDDTRLAYESAPPDKAGAKITVSGYTLPKGIESTEAVKAMQRWLGVKADGIWGPKTQKKFDKVILEAYTTAPEALYGMDMPDGIGTDALTPDIDDEALSYAEDLYRRSIGVGKDDRKSYVVKGYEPPADIKNAADVRAFQLVHGLGADGVWGRRTQMKYDALLQHAAGGDWSSDPLVAGLQRSAISQGLTPAEDGYEDTVIMGWNAEDVATENRAAKGYAIPEGIGDVAAVQAELGVKADGIWGAETEKAYRQAGGKGYEPVEVKPWTAWMTDMTEEELEQTIASIMRSLRSSGLSTQEKQDAQGILQAMRAEGLTDNNVNILKTIEMVGGVEKFFKNMPGFAKTAIISSQKGRLAALQAKISETKDKLGAIPAMARVGAQGSGYAALVKENARLNEEAKAIEGRLNRIGPSDWREIVDIGVEWGELKEWEKAEAKRAAEEKKAAEEAEGVAEEGQKAAEEKKATEEAERQKQKEWWPDTNIDITPQEDKGVVFQEPNWENPTKVSSLEEYRERYKNGTMGAQEILARLIYSEATASDDDEIAAVVFTVVNRVLKAKNAKRPSIVNLVDVMTESDAYTGLKGKGASPSGTNEADKAHFKRCYNIAGEFIAQWQNKDDDRRFVVGNPIEFMTEYRAMRSSVMKRFRYGKGANGETEYIYIPTTIYDDGYQHIQRITKYIRIGKQLFFAREEFFPIRQVTKGDDNYNYYMDEYTQLDQLFK